MKLITEMMFSTIGAVIILALVVGLVLLTLEKKKLNWQLSRRLLLEEQKQIIWIDYLIKKRTLYLSGDLESLYGTLPKVMVGEEVYDVYNWVHEEDLPIRGNVRNFMDGEERHFRAELRVRIADGNYGWYVVRGVLIKDNIDLNERFVLCLENVDIEMSQEKNLLQKAENDLLTGVLNKKTMEERVRIALEGRLPNQHYIFFMIDLDNFKRVNDTLGHIYGDKVIADTAARLKEMFPMRGMIGRLGGDEFAVCLCFEAFDAENLHEYIVKKAEMIRNNLRASYVSDDLEVSVSSSIGIAVAPEFGNDFESLYQKADKALYLSKRSGKDRYSIFANSSAEI